MVRRASSTSELFLRLCSVGQRSREGAVDWDVRQRIVMGRRKEGGEEGGSRSQPFVSERWSESAWFVVAGAAVGLLQELLSVFTPEMDVCLRAKLAAGATHRPKGPWPQLPSSRRRPGSLPATRLASHAQVHLHCNLAPACPFPRRGGWAPRCERSCLTDF